LTQLLDKYAEHGVDAASATDGAPMLRSAQEGPRHRGPQPIPAVQVPATKRLWFSAPLETFQRVDELLARLV